MDDCVVVLMELAMCDCISTGTGVRSAQQQPRKDRRGSAVVCAKCMTSGQCDRRSMVTQTYEVLDNFGAWYEGLA